MGISCLKTELENEKDLKHESDSLRPDITNAINQTGTGNCVQKSQNLSRYLASVEMGSSKRMPALSAAVKRGQCKPLALGTPVAANEDQNSPIALMIATSALAMPFPWQQ